MLVSASIYAASEQTKGRTPRAVRDLLAGVAARALMPPGLASTQTEGVLASAHGTLSVRYRPVPLAIEVVSIGSKPENGPALIVRVPDELWEPYSPCRRMPAPGLSAWLSIRIISVRLATRTGSGSRSNRSLENKRLYQRFSFHSLPRVYPTISSDLQVKSVT
jgi:hypothetical protein